MRNDCLDQLSEAFKRCSDCVLSSEYKALLTQLCDMELSEELVKYLCEKTKSGKHIWEIRLEHLRILLLNPSSRRFDLKAYYYESLKKSRRLTMKLFYIRGYAMYATEAELNPIMERFCATLEKNHDYIDYEHILSAAGLPYLEKTYSYECFGKALQKAREEYCRINPLLRGYFTIDENMNQVDLMPIEEVFKRNAQFLKEHED